MTDFRLLSINLSYIMCENRFLLRIELKKKERERGGGGQQKRHLIQHDRYLIVLAIKTILRV